MARPSILVTGAAGFLGRRVALEANKQGCRVIGLGHGQIDVTQAWNRDVAEWHQGDVTLAALQACAHDVEIIFHCAGSASVAHSVEDPVSDFRRSVDTTLAVLEYIRLSKRNIRLVLPSSAGVYGHAAAGPLLVSQQPNPISPYGVHKRIAEEICQSYATQYGLQCSIVRLFSVYGEGLKKQLLWDACTKLSTGNSEFFGTGDETRDWVHVDDSARLILLAARHASPLCPIVNGGGGEGVAVRDVISVLAAAFPAAPPIRFSQQARSGDPAHYQADISEAGAWGWSPIRHWREGVAAYANWYLEAAG